MGAPLLGLPTELASQVSRPGTLAQCARMNGNANASAAVANNVV